MATGVDTPVVALFGPTVAQFGFFPYVAPSVVLERELDCRPCSATGTAACPLGHHRCLADITPAAVAAAVDRLVAPPAPPRRRRSGWSVSWPTPSAGARARPGARSGWSRAAPMRC